MTYQETVDFLYRQLPMYQRVGTSAFKKSLDNINALLAHLGAPHEAWPSIHIAGTNGKGSTAHLTASILQAAGYKVGLYTSPHYRDFRERVRINGTMISEEAVIDFVAQNRSFFIALQPSFFEISVALAFAHFSAEKVDIAVIETGLGGRLDSTNVLDPILSVITNISLDHQALLGDTLPQIAYEKAGIIKPNRPVLIGQKHPETQAVFEEKAKTVQAPLTFVEDQWHAERIERSPEMAWYRVYRTDTLHLERLALGLSGVYQAANLQTLCAIWETLNELGWPITEAQFLEGCATVRTTTGYLGRWQCLRTNPLTIADAAHNEAGLAQVMQDVAQQAAQGTLHIVLGVVADKTLDKVFPFFPPNAQYYFCQAAVPRALAVDKLATQAAEYGLKGNTYNSVSAALNAAWKAAAPTDFVFVGGSSFVVAEVV